MREDGGEGALARHRPGMEILQNWICKARLKIQIYHHCSVFSASVQIFYNFKIVINVSKPKKRKEEAGKGENLNTFELLEIFVKYLLKRTGPHVSHLVPLHRSLDFPRCIQAISFRLCLFSLCLSFFFVLVFFLYLCQSFYLCSMLASCTEATSSHGNRKEGTGDKLSR